MSIIFDALKRADAQRQKGQAPKLAATRPASQVRSSLRLWALASLFVLLGLSAWWFNAGPTKSSDTVVVNEVVKPENSTRGARGSNVGELTSDPSVRQADLSLREASAEVPAAVVPTDLSSSNGSDLGANSARLSLPDLDTPLTGAAQFDRRAARVVAAPSHAAPSTPPITVMPAVAPEPVNAKPAEAIVPTAPVAAAPEVAPPVVTPEQAAPSAPELPSIFELDYNIRHDLPKMAVSMYVYNAQQQYRFVIIAGKRYAEGEQIESKVSITKIRADGIECEFQGTRFFYPRQSL